MEELRRLVQLTSAEIVVSSSWRQHATLRAGLAEVLARYGLSFARWTCTIRSRENARAAEIFAFVQEEEERTGDVSFVILDDEDIFEGARPGPLLERLAPRHVQTDPIFGLQGNHVDRAAALFFGPRGLPTVAGGGDA